MKSFAAILCAAFAAAAIPGSAQAGTVTGKIYLLEGHVNPACRVLVIKRSSDANLAYYRIPNTGSDNSILAVAIMAFSQDRSVTLVYSDNNTTGCGPEQSVEYIRVTNP